jgi:hypothetical protein
VRPVRPNRPEAHPTQPATYHAHTPGRRHHPTVVGRPRSNRRPPLRPRPRPPLALSSSRGGEASLDFLPIPPIQHPSLLFTFAVHAASPPWVVPVKSSCFKHRSGCLGSLGVAVEPCEAQDNATSPRGLKEPTPFSTSPAVRAPRHQPGAPVTVWPQQYHHELRASTPHLYVLSGATMVRQSPVSPSSWRHPICPHLVLVPLDPLPHRTSPPAVGIGWCHHRPMPGIPYLRVGLPTQLGWVNQWWPDVNSIP